MATNSNMTGSYCLWKSHTSHHIIFITVCAQNVRYSTNASAYRR